MLQTLHPKSPKLIGGRNWCEVTETAISSTADGVGNRTSGSLIFSLRVENPKKMEAEPEVYDVPVPTYVPPRTTAGRLLIHHQAKVQAPQLAKLLTTIDVSGLTSIIMSMSCLTFFTHQMILNRASIMPFA